MLKSLQKMNLKTVLGAALCAVLVAGCGSNSGSIDAPPPAPPAPSTDISADVGALLAYMERLISTDSNADGVDVNAVTLVQDEASEPAAVSF